MFRLIVFTFCVLGCLSINAQELYYDNEGEGFSYDYSWSALMKWRTDGWSVGFEYAQILNLKKRRIFQFEIAEYKSPKEKKDRRPREFGNRPFVYGKQNHFFAFHFLYGNKYMLAEQAKRNGVMINLLYAVGPSLGITKGYFMEVCTETGENNSCIESQAVGYDENDLGNGFLTGPYIGYAGFGEGWSRLGAYPGVHVKLAFQFDWSNKDDFIKAVEVGASLDMFYKEVPILVDRNRFTGESINNNRFYFPNVYIAMQLGKRKFK